MTTVFVDTNIIIDFLTNRTPFGENASELFVLAEEKKIQINVCALSFSNIYYILKRFSTHKKILEKLESISTIVTILPVDELVLKKAMPSKFSDFEDAIQYYCAMQDKKCKVLLTRNEKDFKKSEIAVLSPEQFLKTRN